MISWDFNILSHEYKFYCDDTIVYLLLLCFFLNHPMPPGAMGFEFVKIIIIINK